MALANTPTVDLVIIFRLSRPPPTTARLSTSATKQAIADEATAAEEEYTRLVATLRDAGLKATGRRGEKNGQILVLIWAPWATLRRLLLKERQSDFLRGLPASSLLSLAQKSSPDDLAPADRLRIVYEHITSTPHDGGLGIVPGGKGWERVESVMALHDRAFNDFWIRAWTRRQFGLGIGVAELDKIKDQFGEAIALYFSFLSSYAQSLIYISALGAVFYTLKLPYSATYSALLVLWSVGFVEFWRLRERALAVRWGTRGAFAVEHRRAQYQDASSPTGGIARLSWWQRELRVLASVPVMLAFAGALVVILTGIFVFEAFVTKLYTGPGAKFVGFSPTILFMLLVPKFLGVYQAFAVRLTSWENHAHQSSHDASLAVKTFSLSAVVAYLGLALSAFVYVPFGDAIMAAVQSAVVAGSGIIGARVTGLIGALNGTSFDAESEKSAKVNGAENGKRLWAGAAQQTSTTRLQEQMFAYTVTNQGINTFLEVGLPFITRKIDAFRNGSAKSGTKHADDGASAAGSGKNLKKRVVFEDEETGKKEEREFLAGVRHEAALPEYGLFGDYSEMVTQFGYVALWSTIWPLAPAMSLVNNWLELRSDAFKITAHARRPIPMRTDTIGPWLDVLGVITWLAALTNAALVYLFRPAQSAPTSDVFPGSTLTPPAAHRHTGHLATLDLKAAYLASPGAQTYAQLLVPAALTALAASHAYFVVRAAVRHVLVRALWRGGREEAQEAAAEVRVKEQYLKSVGADFAAVEDAKGKGKAKEQEQDAGDGLDATEFWTRDEGIDEIQKAVKDA